MNFAFDHSYWSAGPKDEPGYASQETLYRDVGLGMLDHSFGGYHTCVFAYGAFLSLSFLTEAAGLLSRSIAEGICLWVPPTDLFSSFVGLFLLGQTGSVRTSLSLSSSGKRSATNLLLFLLTPFAFQYRANPTQ